MHCPSRTDTLPCGAALIDLEPILERLQWLDRREHMPFAQMLAAADGAHGLARFAGRLRRLRQRLQLGPVTETAEAAEAAKDAYGRARWL